MAAIEPRTLKGFRDYLPATMIPRQEMLAKIEGTFQRFGFAPLMTPALEYLDILQGKYGEEGESLLFSFQTKGKRDVALRYDLTVPLARVIGQYGDLILPFRRYQIAPVWRAERPQRGRFREFLQCDGDIVGSADTLADAEILQLASMLLDDLGVVNYGIQINHRKVLSGLMRQLGVADGAPAMGVLRTIDKLPKIGRDKTEQLLIDENALSSQQVSVIFDFLSLSGGTQEVLDELERSLLRDQPEGQKGVAELRRFFEFVERLGLTQKVHLDLSIARGLNYYTGIVYEVVLSDLVGYGAVMGGGRYDGLIGVFKGEDVPAVGISLGIDRLLQGLVDLKLLEEARSVVDVLVTVFDDATAVEAARIAQLLRDGGVSCDLYPAPIKIGKQFRYAERHGLGWVVVVGPAEAAAGTVGLKDLKSGQQVTLSQEEIVTYLKQRLGQSQP